MTEFKKGLIVGMIFMFVIFGVVDLLFSQQQQTPLQQAQAEITRLNIVLKDVKADRDALTVAIATLTTQTKILNQGIIKATGILQRGYNDGKLNYEKLRLIGFNIVVDSTNVYQRPKPNNKANPKK